MFKSPDQTHHRELHIQMHSHILVLIELAGVLGDAYLNHSRGKAFALNPEHIDIPSLALIAIAARQGGMMRWWWCHMAGVAPGGRCKSGRLLGEINGGDKVNRAHAAHRYHHQHIHIRL